MLLIGPMEQNMYDIIYEHSFGRHVCLTRLVVAAAKVVCPNDTTARSCNRAAPDVESRTAAAAVNAIATSSVLDGGGKERTCIGSEAIGFSPTHPAYFSFSLLAFGVADLRMVVRSSCVRRRRS